MVLWSLLLTKGHIYSSCGCLELDRTSTQVFSLCGSALNTQRNETVLTLVGPLTSASPNTAVLANPLLPPYSPPPSFFSSHVTLLTCALWQRSERTPCSGCHGNDLGGPQSGIVVHRHTRSHTAARQAIDILLHGRGGGGGWDDGSCTAVSSLQRHRGN